MDKLIQRVHPFELHCLCAKLRQPRSEWSGSALLPLPPPWHREDGEGWQFEEPVPHGRENFDLVELHRREPKGIFGAPQSWMKLCLGG